MQLNVLKFKATSYLWFFYVMTVYWKCLLMWMLLVFSSSCQVKTSNSLSFDDNNDVQQSHMYFHHSERVWCRWRQRFVLLRLFRSRWVADLYSVCLVTSHCLPPPPPPLRERASLLPSAHRISLFYYWRHYWQRKCYLLSMCNHTHTAHLCILWITLVCDN